MKGMLNFTRLLFSVAYGNSAVIIAFDLWLGGFHTLAHHNERSPTPKRDSN